MNRPSSEEYGAAHEATQAAQTAPGLITLSGTSVDAIVFALVDSFERRMWPLGSRFPSIREFAREHGVSRYAVVEAFDRLVALGYLEARRGSGFFAAYSYPVGARLERTLHDSTLRTADDPVELTRALLQDATGALKVGAPWLPEHWIDADYVQAAVRAVSRRPGSLFLQHGHPLGYGPLRIQLARKVSGLDIPVEPASVLLCTGSSQAIDLIARHFLRPGDAVLVDDPCCFHVCNYLRWYGLKLVPIPRTAQGPDLQGLSGAAKVHQPKAYFTQTVLQNPTGSTTAPQALMRILSIAREWDFVIVEDDRNADFESLPSTRLATLDGLDRVIYLRSFSMTLPGSFRVGFVMANERVIDALIRIKLRLSVSSSQFSEMVLHHLLLDGHYRKFADRLRSRTAQARGATLAQFDALGIDVFCRPRDGHFLWARVPECNDSTELIELANRHNVMLATGAPFRPAPGPSPWMRFNVAYCEDPRLHAFLKDVRPS
jgi:DNA-binding transcriptional MocR family regulator